MYLYRERIRNQLLHAIIMIMDVAYILFVLDLLPRNCFSGVRIILGLRVVLYNRLTFGN